VKLPTTTLILQVHLLIVEGALWSDTHQFCR